MKKKILMAMFATMMTMGLMSTGLTAHAAELPAADAQAQVVKQQLNAQVVAQVFDAKYYAEKNPDVVAVVGTDAAVLMNHYMNNGVYEGRDASATFNASIYALANADLATLYGDNIEGLVEHYVTFGINEGRVASGEALAKADASVKKAFAASVNSVVTTGTIDGTTSFASSIVTPGAVAQASTSYVTNVYGNQVAFGEIFTLPNGWAAAYVGNNDGYHLETYTTMTNEQRDAAIAAGEMFTSHEAAVAAQHADPCPVVDVTGTSEAGHFDESLMD